MTPIADMIEQMLMQNLPTSTIVVAVRTMEHALRSVTLPSRDASRSITQEQNRVRSQRYRNNKKEQRLAKANDMASAGKTVTQDTVTRHVTTLNGTDVSIQEEGISKEGLKKKGKTENARARGTRLEVGAALTNEFIAAAADLGAEHDAIPKIWAEFVDYWCAVPGSRGTKLNWLATWRNRVRDVSKGGKYAQRNSSVRTNSGADQSRTASIVAGVAAATQRRFGTGGQGGVPDAAEPAGIPDPQLI